MTRMESKPYYEAGHPKSVRGVCGHRHRTYEAAESCRQRDLNCCARLGGGAYSDRHAVYEVASDGTRRPVEPPDNDTQ